MRKSIASIFMLFCIISPLSAADKVYHKHGVRGHSHVLPIQGLAHQHNVGKSASSVSNKKAKKVSAGVSHFHGERQHSHVLPKAKQLIHKHGNSPTGSVAKKSATPTQEKSLVTTVKFICSDLTPASAMILYRAGHTYLDRDNDGEPCEPSNYPEYTRPTVSSSSSSNCHMVGGYYRKSGTYVRGHMRCR